LAQLHEALGLDSGPQLVPLPRPSPEDGLVLRLGALLAVPRTLSLGEASLILEASIAGIRTAVPELSDRLAPLGMRVVEDSETLALLPHRTLALLADRAVDAERMPRLTHRHIEVLSIVVFARQATRRRIDQLRGVDSSETVSQLVEWGLLRRTGRDTGDARAHLYQATAKLLEVSGATSLDELRAQLLGMVDGDERALDHPATAASGEPQGPPGPDPVVSEERH
jgi:chromosome segregation and condensation protein ScpB